MESEELREAVLSLLAKLYVPVAADDLLVFGQVVSELSAPAETIASLPHQEFTDFSSGKVHETWICPALEYPTAAAEFEYLTRSDWPVRIRLVDGGPSEAQELMLLRQMCDAAAIAEERLATGEEYDRLMERIDDLAIHIPRAQLEEMRESRTVPTSDVILYREIAEDMYGPLVRTTTRQQNEVAEAIEGFAMPDRYFGRSG